MARWAARAISGCAGPASPDGLRQSPSVAIAVSQRQLPRLRWLAGWLLVLGLLPGAMASPSPPQRVVSINLCADVLLLHLAAREQIASLTFLAASSPLSPVTEQAQGLPSNQGQIEEILALAPDLVVTHQYGNTALAAQLRRLHVPVMMLQSPVSLAAVQQDIERLAEALGRQNTGHALLQRYEAVLASAERPPAASQPVLAVYGPNGITSGPGSLLHDLITRSGFENLAPRLGIGAVGTLGLEALLSQPPDALLISDSGQLVNSVARQKLRHPALQSLMDARPALRLPGRLWTCGGPEALDALGALRLLREHLP